jgi:xylulokinase
MASADPMGMFDIKNKKWSSAILKELDLHEDQLPAAFRTGTVIGNVSEKAAAMTGLKINTPVIAGGGDGQSAGLGSNVLSSKRAYLNLGTAVVAGVYGKTYKTSIAFRTMIACSENGYIFESSLRAGTFALDWFINSILKIDPGSKAQIYNQLRKEAESVPAGSEGLIFLPYLNGVMNPYWDVNARGAFVGLSSFHTRGHMYRSILEGIAFEKLLALKSIEKSLMTEVKELATIGGGAHNKFWCRIFADVTNKNICLPNEAEASALGAAIAASVGAGWYTSTMQAARRMTGIKEIIKPDPANHKLYKRLYRSYCKVYQQTKSIG